MVYSVDQLTDYDWAHWYFVQAATELLDRTRDQLETQMWAALFRCAVAGEI